MRNAENLYRKEDDDAEQPTCSPHQACTQRAAARWEGACNHEIAAALGIAGFTVEAYLKHIVCKLQIRNRTEAPHRYWQRSPAT